MTIISYNNYLCCHHLHYSIIANNYHFTNNYNMHIRHKLASIITVQGETTATTVPNRFNFFFIYIC